jgi:hypothetical protein
VPARPLLVVSPGSALGYGMQDGVLVAQADDAVSWLAHPAWSKASLDPELIGPMIDVLVRHTQRTQTIIDTYRLRAV